MSFKKVHQSNLGVTMIELVMVIVIIGILAAAALPRFSNLSTQAWIASNQQMAGEFRSALGNVHAAWIAAGANSASSGSVVNLSEGNPHVNSLGWEDDAGGGVGMGIVATSGGCPAAFRGLLINYVQYTTSGVCTDTPCYNVTGSGSVCTYTLWQGSSAVSPTHGFTYDLSSGLVQTF